MTLDKLPWLGGQGYNVFQLILHGVQYKKKNGDVLKGSFLPLLFEDLADPILSGREELGFPKVFCNINTYRRANSVRAQLSWQGAVFGNMSVGDLQEVTPQNGVANGDSEPNGVKNEVIKSNGEVSPQVAMTWRVIPPVGAQSQSDSGYCTMTPFKKPDPTAAPPKVWKGAKASVSFDPLDCEALPTIHHIVSRLAEIPVFEVVEATLTHTVGLPTLNSTVRVEEDL